MKPPYATPPNGNDPNTPIHVALLPDREGSGPLLAAVMRCLVPGRVYEVRGMDVESGEVFWIRRGGFSAAQMAWRRLTGAGLKERGRG